MTMTAADEAPYVPRAGLIGKAMRLRARAFARYPLAIRLERPLVSVSFDDFPRSAATVAREALERRGWRGTYYASAGLAGQVNHLGRLFAAEDIVSLEAAGHEIGCHTFSHGDASRSRPFDLIADVERNCLALGQMGLTQAPTTFAFPYGQASPAAKRALMTRYRALRSVRPGINRDGADRALLTVAALEGGEAGIARAIALIEAACREPGWVILYGHDVRDEPSPWGCTPAELERVLAAVAASDAEVLTVRGALDRLGA